MQKAYKYGVELELTVPRGNYDTFCDRVRGIGWMISDDGSVRSDSGYNSIECKTKPLSMSALESAVRKFDTIAEQNEALINTSCGYHLHMSNKRFFVSKHLQNIIKTWCALEDVLQCTQPASRLNNQYCNRKLADVISAGGYPKFSTNKSELVSLANEPRRYKTLNTCALGAHGTLEVRMHSGTVNAKKIMAWARLITLVYDYALTRYNAAEVQALFETVTSEAKISQVFDLLGLSAQDKMHFNNRISKFLIPDLANQQSNAIKAFKLMPGVAKLRKAYEKAERALSIGRRDLNNYTSCFTSD